MTTADWECSRCGSWHGNPSCYVCGAEEGDESEPCWDEPHAWETEETETETENEP